MGFATITTGVLLKHLDLQRLGLNTLVAQAVGVIIYTKMRCTGLGQSVPSSRRKTKISGPIIKNLCENKKSGTLSHNEMDSALVEIGGFEPPAF